MRDSNPTRISAVRPAVLLSLALSVAACGRSPITVAVVFPNSWTLGGETLTGSEASIVKAAAFDTLGKAYEGFAVRFVESPSGNRTIRVEETPYSSPRYYAAGMTYPVARVSSVRFDVLFSLELAAARCPDMGGCSRRRNDLLKGLGRGIGATAAHELGHQAGIRFVRDARCDDCYDSNTSNTAAHFFGSKHWSPEALDLMRRILPR